MTRKDMKYRNSVLRRQAGRQYKDISKLLFDRLVSVMKFQVMNQDDVTRQDLVQGVYTAFNDDVERRVIRKRIKHDSTKRYAHNVANELRKEKNSET